MSQKGFVNFYLLVLAILVGGGYWVFSTYQEPTILLRDCPEDWYINEMPSTDGRDDSSNEYFIYKGVRREIVEFDLKWVKANCSVTPQSVY